MRCLFFACCLLLLPILSTACAPRDEQARLSADPDDNPAPDKARPPDVPASLQARMKAALEHVHRRDLLTTHSFWTVFHGILGLGFDATLLDTTTGKKVKALDYICDGGRIRGLSFIPTPDGVDVETMAGSGVGQGHQDQFVAEMTQWGMPLDRKFRINNKEYTFADFANNSKMRASVKSNQELSWAIVIIGQYYGTDISWTNRNGEKQTFADLVRYEVEQPIDTAACGGTHRLFGLTWVYHLHSQRGGKIEGVWRDVANHIEEYKRKARQYQNLDGSFSTNYVSGPGNEQGAELHISTTGHVLEWLALALSDVELKERWVQDAANALVLMILNNRLAPIDGGALYHAAHGLRIYYDRVFGPLDNHGPPIPRFKKTSQFADLKK
jgi:hypothetical protein